MHQFIFHYKNSTGTGFINRLWDIFSSSINIMPHFGLPKHLVDCLALLFTLMCIRNKPKFVPFTSMVTIISVDDDFHKHMCLWFGSLVLCSDQWLDQSFQSQVLEIQLEMEEFIFAFQYYKIHKQL